MKVQIENNFYLESDSMQFIIKEYTGNVTVDKKTGKEIEQYKTHGYFTNVQVALQHFLKMKIMESTAMTLNELHAEIQLIRRWLESSFSFDLTPPAKSNDEYLESA